VTHASEAPVSPIGVREVSLRGELLQAIRRADAPNYNDRMPRIATLPAGAQTYVLGYEWAHLWGPGLGDESSQGLMLAPGLVNRGLQSHGRVWGIEGYLQRLASGVRSKGGRVYLEATATSFSDPPPGVPVPLGQPVLRRVVYKVIVELADGRVITGNAEIRCPRPLPSGAALEGQPFVAGLLDLIDRVEYV
jgi:hypothetical protein